MSQRSIVPDGADSSGSVIVHPNRETRGPRTTGTPGPSFQNVKLRTEIPAATETSGQTLRPSQYLEELSQLTITH